VKQARFNLTAQARKLRYCGVRIQFGLNLTYCLQRLTVYASYLQLEHNMFAVRQLLVAAVSGFLVPIAYAAPIAYYKSTTGNITFHGLEKSHLIDLLSTSGSLRLRFVNYDPAKNLHFEGVDEPYRISWISTTSSFPDPYNGGDVVTPGTPLSDLRAGYTTIQPSSNGPINIIEIPEPATIVMAGSIAILGSCRRRRGRPSHPSLHRRLRRRRTR
jgi:hypothetical protein